MIEIMIQNLKGGISETKLPGTISHRLIVAIIAGLVGFSTFFATLILFKLYNHLTGHLAIFTIDTSDILLSSVGFVCLFLISFLDNSSRKRS
jgi:uncharacterized membrane protein YqhA